jgi:hypothetical protein
MGAPCLGGVVGAGQSSRRVVMANHRLFGAPLSAIAWRDRKDSARLRCTRSRLSQLTSAAAEAYNECQQYTLSMAELLPSWTPGDRRLLPPFLTDRRCRSERVTWWRCEPNRERLDWKTPQSVICLASRSWSSYEGVFLWTIGIQALR